MWFASVSSLLPSRRATAALRLEVLEGRTVPSFVPAPAFPVNPSLLSAQSDFNHDGISDRVDTAGGRVSVQLGNTDGTFQAPQILGLPRAGTGDQSPVGIRTGDMNNDGNLDLVIVASTPPA